MSNGEIIVNQTSLEEEIEALKNLLSGSGYSRNGTLLSRGYGKTFDALNQMYVDLKEVEEVLMELIQLTATALEKGEKTRWFMYRYYTKCNGPFAKLYSYNNAG